MNVPRNTRLQDLFLQVIDLPIAEREDVLRRECREDAELLEEVRRLLAADALVKDTTAAPMSRQLGESLKIWDAIPGEDSRVGPYELREELGRGGMGRVFRAERVDGSVNQEVAIKFVRWELVDEKLVRRFQLERQLMAGLQHPYIARLIDAGELEDETPYYVMEYIHGIPITEYCRRQALTVRQRVELMRKVCAAVADAHRQLVVHRDLKPGNVLVTIDGTPKLLDFGIAKPLRAVPGHEDTQTQERFFSPGYAAPEQFTGEAVGVSVDVYALGVMLYELLSGEKPFKLDGLTPSQVERLICEMPPEAPSDLLEQAGALQVRQQLAGDLDGIILRCLRKLPSERYASVEQLDNDLENYLKGLPVSARGGERWYRAKKFLARNTLGVAAGIAVAVSVLGGLAGFAWEARKANARAAELQEVVALQAGMLSQLDASTAGLDLFRDLVNRYSTSMQKVDASRPVDVPSAEQFAATLKHIDAADAARGFMLRSVLRPTVAAVNQRLLLSPRLRIELLRTVADRYIGLGLITETVGLEQQMLELGRASFGPDDAETLTAEHRLGIAALRAGDLDGAAAAFSRALQGRRLHLGDDAAETLQTELQTAIVQQRRGQVTDAEGRMRAILERQRRTLDDDHADIVDTKNALAKVLFEQGRYDEALELANAVLASRAKGNGAQADDTADAELTIGRILDAAQRSRDAEPYLRRAVDRRRERFGSSHHASIEAMAFLASDLVHQGRTAEAIATYRVAITENDATQGEYSASSLQLLDDFALCQLADHEIVEAERLLLEVARRAGHLVASDTVDSPKWAADLGMVLQLQRKFAEAEPVLAQALSLRVARSGWRDERSLELYIRLAEVQNRLDKFAAVRQSMQVIEAEVRRRFASRPADLYRFLVTTAEAKAGGSDEGAESAIPYFSEAAALAPRAFGDPSRATVESWRMVAQFLHALGTDRQGNSLDDASAEWTRKADAMEQRITAAAATSTE